MSRPRKTPLPEGETEPRKRQKRQDFTPFKVFFKTFVANLSLVAVRQPEGLVSLFMADGVTGNYSDVLAADEIKAVAGKLFRGRKAADTMIAQFASRKDAISYAETFANAWAEAYKANLTLKPNE